MLFYFRNETVLMIIIKAANPAIQISNIIIYNLFTVNN